MERVKLGKDSYCFCLLSAVFFVCGIVLRSPAWRGGGFGRRNESVGLPPEEFLVLFCSVLLTSHGFLSQLACVCIGPALMS